MEKIRKGNGIEVQWASSSKTEVDGLVAPKANAADVYTKTEVDNMFAWERIEA